MPIQITSPGHSVKYFVSSTMNGTMPKIMSLVRKRPVSLPLTRMMVSILSRSTSVSIHGSHRLEGVGVLGAPQPAIGLLPGAFADVVADGVAEHARHRVGFGEMLCLLADDDDQFALVVDLFGGGRRDHHVLVMRDQRVLRAIADLGPVRHVGHGAGLVGGFLEMLEVIQPDAIEGARDQRQFDLDVLQRMGLRGRAAIRRRDRR